MLAIRRHSLLTTHSCKAMATSARVTSVQAIADFKVALLGFCQEAKEVLASIPAINKVWENFDRQISAPARRKK